MASSVLVEWWNARADEIVKRITSPDQMFSWSQLVWQELDMWERIGKPVDEDEVDFLVNRRGFTAEQRAFLVEGLKVLNLWGPAFLVDGVKPPWVEVPVKRAVEAAEAALVTLRAVLVEGDPRTQAAMLSRADRHLQRARSQIHLADPGPFEDDDEGEEEEILSPLQGGE